MLACACRFFQGRAVDTWGSSKYVLVLTKAIGRRLLDQGLVCHQLESRPDSLMWLHVFRI